MNKKGFTLIELLAVAVILGLMILMVVPNLLETYNNAKEKEKEVLTARLTEAAMVYAENHKNDIEGLSKVNGIGYITLGDIVNEGLLETPIIDPTTNQELPLSTIIKVTRTANNKFAIVFNIGSLPELIILGENPVSIEAGSEYSDEGATAFSSADGDLTDDIVVTDNVNTDEAGTYTVTYSITDSLGNTITKKRTVNVTGQHYAEIEWTFTNASSAGRVGPTQSQIDTAYAGTTLEGDVTVNGGIQTWIVPYTTTYTIEVFGAQGGNNGSGRIGGLGARMEGNFNLTAGQSLKVLVGQQGVGNTYEAGGGGGTFVTYTDNTPLIIAGGGGGASHNENGKNATTITSGTLGGGSGSGTIGINGSGGTGSYGASGSGLTGNGGNSTWGNPPSGGLAFVNGGTGGVGVTAPIVGGFGGGGGAHGNNYISGGGGGGYSGGTGGLSSGYGGGGGGSYNSGTDQDNSAGVNTGHGYVIISITH